MRFAALLFSCAAAFAFAQGKPCTPAESSAAEKAIDRVVNWDQLYRSFQEYRHCDAGPVAEVYTEALMRCLVEWKQVDSLAKAMEKDKDYHTFVMRHLQGATPEDLKSVYSRAKMNCPKGLEGWCTTLADASKPAAPFRGIEIAPMPDLNAPPKK